MKFTAVDIECDQPSDEIIQIGAAAFDTDTGDISRFNGFPDIGRPINWGHDLRNDRGTLGDLIPWGTEHYDKYKEPPEVVYYDFWAWFARNGAGKKIVQWGNINGDVAHIKRSTVDWEGPIPKHFVCDVKSIYKFLYQPVLKLPKGHGLDAAMTTFNIPWANRPHDAVVDAIGTGRVYAKMIDILERYRLMKDLMK